MPRKGYVCTEEERRKMSLRKKSFSKREN